MSNLITLSVSLYCSCVYISSGDVGRSPREQAPPSLSRGWRISYLVWSQAAALRRSYYYLIYWGVVCRARGPDSDHGEDSAGPEREERLLGRRAAILALRVSLGAGGVHFAVPQRRQKTSNLELGH